MWLKQLKIMINADHSLGKNHADLSTARMQRDEADVNNILELFEETWTNPFDPNPSELLCISTGAKAFPEVTDDLLTAEKKG